MSVKQRIISQPTVTVGASKSEVQISLPTTLSDPSLFHAVVSFSSLTIGNGITILAKQSFNGGKHYIPYGTSQSPSAKTAVSGGVLMPIVHTTVGDGSNNEVQTITSSAAPTGGTFVLYWGGQYTTALAYNASATDIQTAFRLITNSSCTVTGTAATAIVITFAGALGLAPQALVQITNNYLYVAATTKVAVATGIWTINTHGFVNNQRVLVSTSDTLPAELTAGSYYVRYLSTNTFTLATTQDGAAITTYSNPGFGTHTVVAADFEFTVAGTNFPTAIFSPMVFVISTGAGDACTVSGVYVDSAEHGIAIV